MHDAMSDQQPEFSPVWNVVYAVQPYALKVLKAVGIHPKEHPFVLGKLNPKYTQKQLKTLLESHGFQNDILSWKDSGQILSMRKVHEHEFQWHIRLRRNGEIRGHYEYAPEGSVFKHELNRIFKPDRHFFISILKDYLVPSPRDIT
jgi:hypothetical protein